MFKAMVPMGFWGTMLPSYGDATWWDLPGACCPALGVTCHRTKGAEVYSEWRPWRMGKDEGLGILMKIWTYDDL